MPIRSRWGKRDGYQAPDSSFEDALINSLAMRTNMDNRPAPGVPRNTPHNPNNVYNPLIDNSLPSQDIQALFEGVNTMAPSSNISSGLAGQYTPDMYASNSNAILDNMRFDGGVNAALVEAASQTPVKTKAKSKAQSKSKAKRKANSFEDTANKLIDSQWGKGTAARMTNAAQDANPLNALNDVRASDKFHPGFTGDTSVFY